MKTFHQFLQEKVNLVSAINPARPAHHRYAGLAVKNTYPVIKFHQKRDKGGVIARQ